jgi:hypothetical protein
MNKKFKILFCLSMVTSIGFSQNKKDQIEALNFTIDSIVKVLGNERQNNTISTNSFNNTIRLLETKLKNYEEEKIEKEILIKELQNNIKLLQDSITKLIQNKTQSKVFNGDFINSKNQIFRISNHIIDQEFDFSVKYGLNDEWGCFLKFEGTAKIMTNRDIDNSENVTYYVGEFDYPYLTFIITKGEILDLIISWESSPDCSKFGDSQTETYTRFIKVNQ